jgi:hypothetical protein
MTTSLPLRRLAPALALALALCALVAALIGASQTFAQARRAACPGAHAHKRHSHGCATGKGKPRRASKRRGKHTHGKTKGTGRSHGSGAPAPAQCEDGDAPVLISEGSFSCEDGSEPECKNDALPVPSSNGQSLVCPVSGEHEPGAGEANCEELEEQESGCGGEPGAQACEAADATCEQEAQQ